MLSERTSQDRDAAYSCTEKKIHIEGRDMRGYKFGSNLTVPPVLQAGEQLDADSCDTAPGTDATECATTAAAKRTMRDIKATDDARGRILVVPWCNSNTDSSITSEIESYYISSLLSHISTMRKDHTIHER